MRFRAILKLVNTFVLSQARASRRKYFRRFARRPSVILAADFVTFVSAFAVAYGLMGFLPMGLDVTLVTSLIPQALTVLPIMVFSLLILMGLIGEINASNQFASSEIVNWLPITPSEYVLASAFSVMYTYSIVVAAGLGATLPLALHLPMLHVWATAAIMSVAAAFMGGLMVEMLRAVTNRVSATFQGQSGGSVTAFRLIAIIIILAVLQLLFNPIFMLPIIQMLVGAVNSLWYLPVFWPSLLISESLKADMMDLAKAGLLNVIFLLLIFLLSVGLRRRYWVPLPVSMKTTSVYMSKPSLLEKLLLNLRFSGAQTAIVRKDLRSLTRRREMMRFLAVPVVLVLPQLLTINVAAHTEPFSHQPFTVFLFASSVLMSGLVVFTFMISMTSVGQEGQAVWNIYLAPISDRDFLWAKLSSVLIISLPTTLITAFLLTSIFYLAFDALLLFLTVALCLVVEAAYHGLAIGCSSPDFTEGPRSRFVSISGAPFVAFLGAVALLITGAPFGLYTLFRPAMEAYGFSLLYVTGATIALTVVFSWISQRFTRSAVKKLLIEMRED